MKKGMRSVTLLDDFDRQPISKKKISGNWAVRACLGGIGSIICLIILVILLALPITVLIIGTRYRDPRYCPIQPRISVFLMVNGGVSLGYIIFSILALILITISASRRSFAAIILIIIFGIVLALVLIFSLIWLIIGSVWTFGVRNRVIHEYDRMNNFYLYTYCHPVLYKFTFAYLIVSYILIAFQCCQQYATVIFGRRQKT